MSRLNADSVGRSESSLSISAESDFADADSGVASHDGQLFSSLIRRRSSKDSCGEDSEHGFIQERRSPLPTDADMASTLEWLRKEMAVMRNQDQQLLREFMKIRAGIQHLRSQQDASPMSSRSSTPDMGTLADVTDRATSPAAAAVPPRTKRMVTFRVRSSPMPGTVLQTLTKADKLPSPVASPVSRTHAATMDAVTTTTYRRPARNTSTSSSTAANDWEFVSSSTRKDADSFMSELSRSLGGAYAGKGGKTEASSPFLSLPRHGTTKTNSVPTPSPSADSRGSPSNVESPVAVIADANEDSSEC